ncbi:Mbov_0401 family ICE element transposase-like protein [[Mycoplasma] anseris]|uniref:Transposase n=1 Tax=[Mycoplasma] anseris TaxID=92400 RepID=A0A2Z4NDA5_9BACT|nr:UPF0236 family protein [[Mycoplasma] anseris]AWX69563.1 hypothetical protein DP065_02245 [[Mycoplasma] anseris]
MKNLHYKEDLNFYKNDIEAKDLMYRNSIRRKQEGWEINCYITRKFITINGSFEVKITKYRKKENNKWKYYTFNNHWFLQRNKNHNIDINLKEKCKESFNRNSYQEIAYQLGISKSTIFNIIHANLNTNIDTLKSFKNNQTHNQKLYISVDDTYVPYKEKQFNTNKCCVRILNFFNKTKNNKLINKNHLLLFNKSKKPINNKTLYAKINKIMKKFYNETCEIIILGDGAKWIQNLAKRFNGNGILCRYHLMAKVKKLFDKSKETKQIINKTNKELNFNMVSYIYDDIDNEKWDDLLNFLTYNQHVFNKYFNKFKLKQITDLKKYIFNNKDYLVKYSKNSLDFIGNNAESFVSHIIKNSLKKDYSRYGLNTIISIISRPYQLTKFNLKIEIL